MCICVCVYIPTSKSACKPVDAGAGSHGDDSFGLAAASTWIPAAHTPGRALLSATIDNPSGSRVVVFNPVVADLPAYLSTPVHPLAAFSSLLSASHLLSFPLSLPFHLRGLLPPSILSHPPLSVGRSEAAWPPDMVVHHSYPARSFPSSRMSNAGTRFGRRFGFLGVARGGVWG